MSIQDYNAEIRTATVNTILRLALNISIDTSLDLADRQILSEALKQRYLELNPHGL